jgi:regulator of protease activity HflC (stomatin/prohibitin superfamily)
MENQGLPRVVVFGLLGVVLLFIFGSSMFTTIQPGEKGVKFYKLSGLDTKFTYGQGLNFHMPWDEIIVYNVKTQTLAIRVDGKDTNGVQCALAMNIIYHPLEDSIGVLENEIGEDYVNTLIKPKIGDIALTVIKEYTYDQIISNKKDE